MRRSNVTLFHSSSIVYFRIFDVDGNKKIDEADLQAIMTLLFGTRMSEEDTKMLQEKILEEADTG
jgi:hypothetical protein